MRRLIMLTVGVLAAAALAAGPPVKETPFPTNTLLIDFSTPELVHNGVPQKYEILAASEPASTIPGERVGQTIFNTGQDWCYLGVVTGVDNPGQPGGHVFFMNITQFSLQDDLFGTTPYDKVTAEGSVFRVAR